MLTRPEFPQRSGCGSYARYFKISILLDSHVYVRVLLICVLLVQSIVFLQAGKC